MQQDAERRLAQARQACDQLAEANGATVRFLLEGERLKMRFVLDGTVAVGDMVRLASDIGRLCEASGWTTTLIGGAFLPGASVRMPELELRVDVAIDTILHPERSAE